MFEAFNAHARLIDILRKVVKHVYPSKRPEQRSDADEPETYTIKYTDIKGIAQDLVEWREKLPARWRPGSGGSEEVKRYVIKRPNDSGLP